MDAVIKSLEVQLKCVQDLNSLLPETKKFLESKGLKNVRELDSKGFHELKEHLLHCLGALPCDA